MLQDIRSWLNRIPFSDPLVRRQAALLQITLLLLLGSGVIGLPLFFFTGTGNSAAILVFVVYGVIFLSAGAAVALLRRGSLRLSANLAIDGLILAIGGTLVATGLHNSGNALLALTLPVVLAGLLLGRRDLLMAIGLCIGVVVLTAVLERLAPAVTGVVPNPPMSAANVIPAFVLIVGTLGLVLDRFGSSMRDALTLLQAREQDLDGLRASLESTVAQRTAALEQALEAGEQREAHLAQTLAELHASQETIREMSAPVLPVLPGVLVAPLVGVLDSARASALTHNLLQLVQRERAHHVIFDITGVPLVDTAVARVLIETTTAVRLLGARSLLVGIRPEVAQTLVAINVDFADLRTYPDLQAAVGALRADQAAPAAARAR